MSLRPEPIRPVPEETARVVASDARVNSPRRCSRRYARSPSPNRTPRPLAASGPLEDPRDLPGGGGLGRNPGREPWRWGGDRVQRTPHRR